MAENPDSKFEIQNNKYYLSPFVTLINKWNTGWRWLQQIPKFTTPVSWTLREVMYNDTTTRYNIYLKWLGVKKYESGDVAMMLKTGKKMVQDYIVFNYTPQDHIKI